LQTDFTTGSGKKIGGSLTGRTINTTTAVTADGTPKNGTNLERPNPKSLETLFGTFNQDSMGYDAQGDAEDLYLSSQDSDDNIINMSQKEEERYRREHGKEDDANTILSEDEPDATNYGDNTEDNSDASTDSGGGNKEPTHEDYNGNVPHPRLNTNVSNRNTEETGENGTPLKHTQSIDPSSNGDGIYSVETIIQHAVDGSITNKATVNTGKQNEEEVKLPPKPPSNRPTPPTCKQHDPTNIETKIVAKNDHGLYIEGTNIRKIVSITTWTLEAIPTEYNCLWEEPPCVLIPALQHYCIEGHSFETPRGWAITLWTLKQGYPFANDKKLKRMPGLEALERLENMVQEHPEQGRLKQGAKIKLPPALVKASERAAENQKIVIDAGVRLARCKWLLTSRTKPLDIKNLNDEIFKYEKKSAIARDRYAYFTTEVSCIKIACIQRLKVLKATAVKSCLAADQQKIDDDFCRSLEIEVEKEALGTRNEDQDDTNSALREGFSVTTDLSQYNTSTTKQPTNVPV
jgi:hypothetical protein